jgi:hypothetical protein
MHIQKRGKRRYDASSNQSESLGKYGAGEKPKTESQKRQDPSPAQPEKRPAPLLRAPEIAVFLWLRGHIIQAYCIKIVVSQSAVSIVGSLEQAS